MLFSKLVFAHLNGYPGQNQNKIKVNVCNWVFPTLVEFWKCQHWHKSHTGQWLWIIFYDIASIAMLCAKLRSLQLIKCLQMSEQQQELLHCAINNELFEPYSTSEVCHGVVLEWLQLFGLPCAQTSDGMLFFFFFNWITVKTLLEMCFFVMMLSVWA